MKKSELKGKELNFMLQIIKHLNAINSTFDNSIKVEYYYNNIGNVNCIEYVASSKLQYDLLENAIINHIKHAKDISTQIQFENYDNWYGLTFEIRFTDFSIELFYEA